MPNDTFWWRLIHLEPALWRGVVVAVVALLAAAGVLVSPAVPDALLTLIGVLSATAQWLWTRPAVTANARVVVLAPEPMREPALVAGGEAVTTAPPRAILAAADSQPPRSSGEGES